MSDKGTCQLTGKIYRKILDRQLRGKEIDIPALKTEMRKWARGITKDLEKGKDNLLPFDKSQAQAHIDSLNEFLGSLHKLTPSETIIKFSNTKQDLHLTVCSFPYINELLENNVCGCFQGVEEDLEEEYG